MKFPAFVSVLLVAFSVLSVHAKDEGFAGRWVLDKSSPRPGDCPNQLEQRIKHDGSGLTIESTFKEPAKGMVPLLYLGVMTTKLHLNANGEDQQNQVGPFQMGSRTKLNGHQMDTDWTAMVKGDQVQGHWTHTLSEDGKRMTLQIQESSTQGQHGEATLYFVRK